MNPTETTNQTEQMISNASDTLHVQILRDLIAMKTATGDHEACGHALDYIERFLEERGMFTRRYESNGFQSLVATVQPNQMQPTVLLTGHIDVVPGADNLFAMRAVDGNYYGRGIYDMKFALASYLSLVDSIKDNLQDYDFGIIITTDEEVGGNDGMKVLVKEGYRPKIAIVPDGGDNWQIQEIAKGIQWIKLTATGTTGHASQPWRTDNAIHKLLAALSDIRALVPQQPTLDDPFRSSLSVGLIQGGEAANQAAPLAVATIDIRYGNMEDYANIPAAIQDIAQKHGIHVDIQVDDPPTSNSLTNPFIAEFRRIMIKHIGYEPEPSKRFAATDARFFNQAGVPAVIVSPVGGDCHSEKEWLSAATFEQFHAILHEYVVHTSRIQHAQNESKQNLEQLVRHLAPPET